MNANLQAIRQLDAQMVARFWDAEAILREADSNDYVIWPREPRDEPIAASLGAAIAVSLAKPVLIWRNDTEES